MKVARNVYPVYRLDKTARTVAFQAEHIRLIAEYSDFLFDAINYRWAQILEKFNHSPRIAQKVRGIAGDEEPKRKSLRQFRRYLDLDPVTRDTCFQCGKHIPEDTHEKALEVSVDHIMPWSFMYSDDLWNLAYCHTGCNSKKSNMLPSSRTISRLGERNERLLEELPPGKKIHSEMQMALDQNYLHKFWISFKG
jgi:5-methylcytosine-specific restriction endonuclease McrA